MTMEVVTRVAALGLRFWDEVTNDLVRDGLLVTTWPETQPSRVVRAIANRSGVWVFSSLPGLRAFENGRGDDAYWQAVSSGSDPDLGARRSFVVEVRDQLGRFVPVRLHAQLPVRGIFNWAPSGLPTSALPISETAPPGVLPLFSSPQRATAGQAIVRAQLEDAMTGRLASDALVEVVAGGFVVGRGLSDSAGRVLVTFPYPELESTALGSPFESPPGRAPSDWSWELELRVRWSAPTSAASVVPASLTHVFSQPLVTALASRTPEDPLQQVTLRHAEDLVLRSIDSEQGRLWIRA